jgi:anoctamin-10/anoctamin-7
MAQAQVPNRHKSMTGDGDPNQAPVREPTVVLVFERAVDEKGSIVEQDGDKAVKERGRVRAALVTCNLSVEDSKSLDEKFVFFRVSIPISTMKTEAERRMLPVRFTPKAAPPLGAWVPFFAKGNTPSTMEPSDGKGPFSSLQMCYVIEEMFTMEKKLGGAGLDFDKLRKEFGFVEYFYLHHDDVRHALEEKWGMHWTAKQPLGPVRTYFGDKIGLYFAFLGYYTSSLWIPAIVGLLMTLTQLYSYAQFGSIDNPFVPLFCCFMSLWGVIFCNNWKQIESRLQYEWNTRHFEFSEKPRAAFLQASHRTETRKGLINPESIEVFYNPTWRLVWISLSACVCFAFITVVLFATCYIFVLKDSTFPHTFGPSGAILGGLLNAVSIMIMNFFYEHVEHRLTDQELWRTDTEHEDSLIAKDFAFKFVNSYFSLFFTAFILGNVDVLGHRLSCPAEGCANTVMETLGFVFISQIIFQQIFEIGVPAVQKRIHAFRAARELALKGDAPRPASREQVEFFYPKYPGVFYDYQELVIQFGYVTMFAAAFPLTATLALINNILEIRVDAMKLLTGYRRPFYNSAQDIGSWQHVLDILVTVSIMTNVPSPSSHLHQYFLVHVFADCLCWIYFGWNLFLFFQLNQQFAIMDCCSR